MVKPREGRGLDIPTSIPDMNMPIIGWTADGYAIVGQDGVRYIDTQTRITDVLDTLESSHRSTRERNRGRTNEDYVEEVSRGGEVRSSRGARAIAKIALFGAVVGGMTAAGYYQSPAINRQDGASVTDIVDDYRWGLENPQQVAAFLVGSNVLNSGE